MEDTAGLSGREITKLVNRYIGVKDGYLGNFSYRTHTDFYPEYCDLDVNPNNYDGTTRERFIEILSSRSPRDQAKILSGVLERFPVDDPSAPPSRAALAEKVRQWIVRLERGGPVGVSVADTRAVVLRALEDANSLLRTQGATSGVDRVHTALHGHLLALCDSAGIVAEPDTSMTGAFKLLRRQHPKLQDLGPRAQDIERVLNAAASIFDALQPVRNRASVAHPNEHLLDEPEAMLVISVGHLLNYLDAKLRQ